MGLLGRRLCVSIPDTVLEERDSLRDKTVKLGLIARACSIYGVDLVQVFRDRGGRGEPETIRRIMEYLETPQYLRKRLFPLSEELRFAGLLPPLRIPSHKQKIPVEMIPIGEVREGVTNKDGTVDIGLDQCPVLRKTPGADRRVTVKIASRNPLTAEAIPREEVKDYWGYGVETVPSEEVFSDRRFETKVATSRLGDPLATVLTGLRKSLRSTGGVKLVFGSPTRGLFDIFGGDMIKRSGFVVNLFADQHVETVRTEEAIFAALGLVNVLAT